MLVVAVVTGNDDHGPDLPIAFDHVGAVVLGPNQGETTGAAEQHQMRARAMAVSFLVRAYGELGHVALHVVVGHLQHGVNAAGASLLPSI